MGKDAAMAQMAIRQIDLALAPPANAAPSGESKMEGWGYGIADYEIAP